MTDKTDVMRGEFEAAMNFPKPVRWADDGKLVDSWHQACWIGYQAALQSVRPPVGVVSDEDVRWMLAQMRHNEFSHDYIKDEKRCEVCQRIKRISSLLASRHAPTKD